MSETTKQEIIRRAKAAALRHGKPRPKYKNTKEPGKTPFVYSLPLQTLRRNKLSIFWMPYQRNLRIRLSITELGHLGSRCVLDLHENRETEIWHYPDSNDEILSALRNLMLLDDLADVSDG